MITYEDAVKYISEIPRFAPKTDLENTRILLEKLGNPEQKYKTVHVAGTNGKGSVSKMIALMLEKQGFRVGLFISPHLIKMNERMSVNGTDITDDKFVDLFCIVKKSVEELLSDEAHKPDNNLEQNSELNSQNQSLSDSGYMFQHPAYFEYIFVMAAKYFADQKCDYVVFETGLGGRLDATNVITPEVSVITSIGMDHMQYLGNTIEKIAGEKAGIIKKNIPVVFNTGNSIADSVILKRAKEIGTDTVNITLSEPELLQLFKSTLGENQPLYQYDNAATATAAFLVITGRTDISEIKDVLSYALTEFKWPGRCEYVLPNVIIDGAHNEDAAEKLVKSIRHICERDSWKKVSLFFAVSSDKDYESIIRILVENLEIEDVYVTEINSDRKQDTQVIMKLFQKYLPDEKHFNVYGSRDMKRHLELAINELDEDTLLLCVGSLYMVGEIKEIMRDNKEIF